jgi:hypothetical protein
MFSAKLLAFHRINKLHDYASSLAENYTGITVTDLKLEFRADKEQLGQLLQTTQYERDELNAFMTLQRAAMEGYVQQESRELYPMQ